MDKYKRSRQSMLESTSCWTTAVTKRSASVQSRGTIPRVRGNWYESTDGRQWAGTIDDPHVCGEHGQRRRNRSDA